MLDAQGEPAVVLLRLPVAGRPDVPQVFHGDDALVTVDATRLRIQGSQFLERGGDRVVGIVVAVSGSPARRVGFPA